MPNRKSLCGIEPKFFVIAEMSKRFLILVDAVEPCASRAAHLARVIETEFRWLQSLFAAIICSSRS